MKNEYRVLSYPECVDGRDLENTINREGLVKMVGFCTAVNGDGVRGVSGHADALEGLPVAAIVALLGRRCA